MEDNIRGDTLADYFENVQWQVQFANLAPSGTENLGETLPVDVETFSMQELRAALRSLAVSKAPGQYVRLSTMEYEHIIIMT